MAMLSFISNSVKDINDVTFYKVVDSLKMHNPMSVEFDCYGELINRDIKHFIGAYISENGEIVFVSEDELVFGRQYLTDRALSKCVTAAYRSLNHC